MTKLKYLNLRPAEVPRFLRPSGLVVIPLDKRFETINIGPSVQFTHPAFHSGTIGIERLCKEYCPLGGPGTEWVGREAFIPCRSIGFPCKPSEASYVCFRDGEQQYRDGKHSKWTLKDPPNWKAERHVFLPARRMPLWAARIRKTTTRVELRRVRTITEGEAIHAGISQGGCFNCGGNQPCGCERPEPSCRETWVREFLARYGHAWHRDDYCWFVFYTDTH